MNLKYKLIGISCLSLFNTSMLFTQNVGINSTGAAPNAAAMLDVASTTKGLLIPRVALSATNNNAPIGAGVVTSLLVYNTATAGSAPNNVTPGYYYWSGSAWLRFMNTASGWLLTGNAGTTAGTDFIGTTDAIDWVVKTNNTERMRIASGGNVGIGATPSNDYRLSTVYAPTSINTGINAINGAGYNSVTYNSGTNNAAIVGNYNLTSVTTNNQNQMAYYSGLVAGAFNYASANTNTGSNVLPTLGGKVVGTYNYAESITTTANGGIFGDYNYAICATTLPATAHTYGTYNYAIVNSPNDGTILGASMTGEANGTNNATGIMYGANIKAACNGANNGTLYGAKILVESNGLNNGLRYGVHVTNSENGGTGSAGNVYGLYSNMQTLAGSPNTVYGLYAQAGNGAINYAGYFQGDVMINGNFTATGVKAFTIDHPLAPATKYLKHYCTEGQQPYNVYRGNVVTDNNGLAVVQLPDYCEAINKEFTYQLTVLGEDARAYVKQKIANNQFIVKTDRPNVEVSWMVTGIRNDEEMRKNQVLDVVEKKDTERGKYLTPQLYGQPQESGIHYVKEEKKAYTPPVIIPNPAKK